MTNKLSTRINLYQYHQTCISNHFPIDHDRLPPIYNSLKDMFKVIYRSSDTQALTWHKQN